MRQIFVVEKGILMDGIGFEYDNVYHASSLDIAKNYINDYCIHMNNLTEAERKLSMNDEDYDPNDWEYLVPEIVKIADNYWKCEIDYDSRFGIERIELDASRYFDENGGI